MPKSRGHKSAHSRAGHKRKNKRTYRGRFRPLEDPAKVLNYLEYPKPEMLENIKDVFKKQK